MPLYYLHIRDLDGRTEDTEGEQLHDLDLAIEAAIDSARELLIERLKQHKRGDGFGAEIEIADKEGGVLAVIKLSDVAQGKR